MFEIAGYQIVEQNANHIRYKRADDLLIGVGCELMTFSTLKWADDNEFFIPRSELVKFIEISKTLAPIEYPDLMIWEFKNGQLEFENKAIPYTLDGLGLRLASPIRFIIFTTESLANIL